jgi:TonB family protein
MAAAPSFWLSALWGVYLLGCCVALGRFLYGLITLAKYYRRGRKHWEDGLCWVESDADHAPFSWLNLLFWSTRTQADAAEREAIIAHERAHIRQRHSWDILLLEIVGILFWWHPLWYAYRYELTNVHEYLADAAVLTATPTREYGKLLLRQCLRQPELPLVQPFHTSQLKKRIIMMTKSPSTSLAMGKYLLFLPLTLLLLFSFENVKAQEGNKPAATTEATFFELVDTIVVFDPASSTETVSIVKSKIYKKVDQMPVFGDCDHLSGDDVQLCSQKSLLTFIYKNVEYPQAAKEAGQEGTAIVQFVVDRNGKVTDPQALKGKTTEYAALNEEALRVLRMLPDFKPGMHEGEAVSVQMVMPIKFKL